MTAAEALAKLINWGSFHGVDLVKGTPGPDNVCAAEKALLRAEKAGLVERGKYEPSREQCFFGIGGFPGDKLDGLAEAHRSPVAYHWITKTTKWLRAEDIP